MVERKALREQQHQERQAREAEKKQAKEDSRNQAKANQQLRFETQHHKKTDEETDYSFRFTKKGV